MSIVIRKAQESDAESIAQYFTAFYATDPDTVFSRPNGIPQSDVLNLIKQSDATSGMLFLIALDGAATVGTLTFSRHGKPEMSHGGEFGMSVHPEYRRQGIGSSLISQLEKWAANNGIEKLDLQVWSNNTAGIALYEAARFKREGVRKGAIKRINDTFDIILMTKVIGHKALNRTPTAPVIKR